MSLYSGKRSRLAAGLVLGVAFVATSVSAHSFKTLYSFCSLSLCADGDNPQGGLLADSQGNLFGTTKNGGAHALNLGDEGGTVFELIRPVAPAKKWKFMVLYSFCASEGCYD